MKVLRWIGKALLIFAGAVAAVAFVLLAARYRPGAVMGKLVDPGPIDSIDGGSVRVSDYAGRVVLLSFATNH